MNDNLINENIIEEEDFVPQIKKEISYYFFFWPYFLVSTSLLLVVAFFYLRYEERVYQANAQIQIKKENSDAATFFALIASRMEVLP